MLYLSTLTAAFYKFHSQQGRVEHQANMKAEGGFFMGSATWCLLESSCALTTYSILVDDGLLVSSTEYLFLYISTLFGAHLSVIKLSNFHHMIVYQKTFSCPSPWVHT